MNNVVNVEVVLHVQIEQLQHLEHLEHIYARIKNLALTIHHHSKKNYAVLI